MTPEELTSPFSPGPYTIQWICEQETIGPIDRAATARKVGAIFQAFGRLANPQPRGLDVEVVNNPVQFDKLTGVVRINLASPTTRNEMGMALVESLRLDGFPTLIPTVGFELTRPASWAAAVGSFFGIGEDRSPDEFFNTIGECIVTVNPGINADARPLLGASVPDAALTWASNRQSDDQARNGSVAIGQAAAAARSAGETAAASFRIPTWAYWALAGGGVVIVGVLTYALYKRISGE